MLSKISLLARLRFLLLLDERLDRVLVQVGRVAEAARYLQVKNRQFSVNKSKQVCGLKKNEKITYLLNEPCVIVSLNLVLLLVCGRHLLEPLGLLQLGQQLVFLRREGSTAAAARVEACAERATARLRVGQCYAVWRKDGLTSGRIYEWLASLRRHHAEVVHLSRDLIRRTLAGRQHLLSYGNATALRGPTAYTHGARAHRHYFLVGLIRLDAGAEASR